MLNIFQKIKMGISYNCLFKGASEKRIIADVDQIATENVFRIEIFLETITHFLFNDLIKGIHQNNLYL